MAKFFGLIIFLIFFSLNILGSSQTDPLSKIEFKNRLNLALANANDEPDISLLIINEAISQAEKNKDKNCIHLAYITLGRYYLLNNQYDEALLSLNQAYLNALGTGVESLIHEAVTLLSQVHLAKEIKVESLEYLYKGLEISMQLRDSSSISWFLIQIPEVEQEVGNISRAMEYALRAKSFFEDSNNELELGITLLNLGAIHLKLGNLPLSRENIKNAIQIVVNQNDSLFIGKAKLALSKLHLLDNKPERAETYCHESMELLRSLNEREFYRAKSQLGEILIIKKQYSESNTILIECLKYQQVNDDISGQAYTYLRLAKLHQANKQTDKAIEAYRNSLLNSTNIGLNDLIRLGYKGLSQVFGSIGDHKRAYINLSHYTRITDSLFNIQKISEASKLEESYKYDQHKREIQAKEEELNKRNDKITEQRQNQILLYLLSVLFLGIAIFAMREFYHKKKANEKLALQKKELEVQKNIADRRTRDFTDSLNYAKRIQQAILRVSLKIKDLFPESFIILFPRNIVSGDFFWVKERSDKILFALADCTGHGVPGALMSIIGTYGLNRFADEMEITSPSEMLYHLNILFEESFKQKEGAEIFDGMDIALCSYNPKTKELIYAGANIALFILRESKQVQPSRTLVAKGITYTLYNIKPNKQPIGSYFDKKPFVNHSIDLMENDIVYLFSDGFYDQFGGPDGRKYKSAQLYKLLCSIGDKSLESQKLILEETFKEWKGSRNQLDDVTLMGIKI